MENLKEEVQKIKKEEVQKIKGGEREKVIVGKKVVGEKVIVEKRAGKDFKLFLIILKYLIK